MQLLCADASGTWAAAVAAAMLLAAAAAALPAGLKGDNRDKRHRGQEALEGVYMCKIFEDDSYRHSRPCIRLFAAADLPSIHVQSCMEECVLLHHQE